MAMLYPEEFWAIHGLGAKVYDAAGRQLPYVMACDLETGEVIMWSQGTYSPLDWIRWRLRRAGRRWDWLYGGTVHTRHGFWPAPFRVTKPYANELFKQGKTKLDCEYWNTGRPKL